MATVCSIRNKTSGTLITLSLHGDRYAKTQVITRPIGPLTAHQLLNDMETDCNSGVATLEAIDEQLVKELRIQHPLPK